MPPACGSENAHEKAQSRRPRCGGPAIRLAIDRNPERADLSASCCGNLENQVAELEATMERKGNRKVRLTVSDWVAENAARSRAHPHRSFRFPRHRQ
jgi:hypothetical protein